MKLYQKYIEYDLFGGVIYTDSGVNKDKKNYIDEAREDANAMIASLTIGLNDTLTEREELQSKIDKLKMMLEDMECVDLIEWYLNKEDIRYIEVEVID